MRLMTDEEAIGLESVTLLLATIFVFLRGFVQVYLRRMFTASDGFVLIAFIILVIVFVMDIMCYRVGEWVLDWSTDEGYRKGGEFLQGPGKNLEWVSKMLWVAGPMDFLAMWCIKAAFLLFYFVLIPKAFRWLRVCLWLTTLFSLGTGLFSVCILLFKCLPVSRNYHYGSGERCIGFGDAWGYWFTIGTHIGSDLAIYLLPFFLLPYLQLTRQRKFGAAAVFGLGFISIGVAVLRIVLVYKTSFRQSYTNSLSKLEIGTALIVVCAPPLKNLRRWLTLGRRNRRLESSVFEIEKGEDLEWGTLRFGFSTVETDADVEHVEAVVIDKTQEELELERIRDAGGESSKSSAKGPPPSFYELPR